MGKMSTVFALSVLVCALEQCVSMGTYYWTYPDAASAYAYPAPYQPFPAYQPILPVDCDQNKVEGSSSEAGEAGEPKSEGEEGSTEEAGSSEGGEATEESSTEEGGNKEEVGEIKEGGEENKEEGEQKEGGEPAEEGEKKEGGEEKVEGEKKEGEEKKTNEMKPVPPVTYTFPPRPVQQYIVSVPANYPYRTYSIIQQQSMPYPVKSSGSYYSYSSVPAPSGFSGPVVKSISTAPVARYVTRYVSPVAYSVSPSNGYQSATYWNPTGNVGYYKY